MPDRNRAARHAARRRVSERYGREGCPTPDRAAYDLRSHAEALLAERQGRPGAQLYECPCGFWHYGYRPTRSRV